MVSDYKLSFFVSCLFHHHPLYLHLPPLLPKAPTLRALFSTGSLLGFCTFRKSRRDCWRKSAKRWACRDPRPSPSCPIVTTIWRFSTKCCDAPTWPTSHSSISPPNRSSTLPATSSQRINYSSATFGLVTMIPMFGTNLINLDRKGLSAQGLTFWSFHLNHSRMT